MTHWRTRNGKMIRISNMSTNHLLAAHRTCKRKGMEAEARALEGVLWSRGIPV